jgi:hypothetical protein
MERSRQLAGLRSYATRRREATVEQLRVGIDALTAEGQPITARTISERTGLAYNSYARNQRRTRSIARRVRISCISADGE